MQMHKQDPEGNSDNSATTASLDKTANAGMSREDFAAYVQAFNTQDPEIFARKYFTPDVTFERRDHRITRGMEQYIKEYYASHDGLTEVLNPQRVLIDGNNIAMEVNVDFAATKDQPNFIIQPMRAGDKLMVKLFVFYTIRAGRIAHVKSARWNPGQS